MNANYHASSLERLPSGNFSAAAEVKKSKPRPLFGNRPFTRSWFPAASGGNLRHSSTPMRRRRYCAVCDPDFPGKRYSPTDPQAAILKSGRA